MKDDVRQRTPNKHMRIPLLMFALVILCAASYVNGLFGGFLFDDYSNIVNNPSLPLLDGSTYRWLATALSSDAGMLRRPISMLSFGLNYYAFGLNPIAFKATNVVIHLFNGYLLYALSLRLLPYLVAQKSAATSDGTRHLLALLVAALWLLHPLNVSGVVYVVQRMNQLATLFVLAGLCCYAEGRVRMLKRQSGSLVAVSGVIVFGLLATLSKENGALIILYAFVIEIICFRFANTASGSALSVRALFVLALALPTFLVVTYLCIHPHWLLGGYTIRDFTLQERLLTEPRILLHYLLWIFVPLPQFMGIYHDDIPLSTSLFAPVTTFAAIIVLALAIVTAWKLRLRRPGISFAIAWFLAGHSMESTLLALELVFEHRNYLPMAGLLLGITADAQSWSAKPNTRIVWTACLAVAITLSGLTFSRNLSWRSPITLSLTAAKHHPLSPRSLYDAGRATIYTGAANNHLEDAKPVAGAYFTRAMALDKTYVFPSVSYMLTQFDGRAVDEQHVEDLEFRLRNAPLFQATPFLTLLNAIADGKVRMSRAQVERLFQAGMDNPSARSGMRAMMLNNYGRYLFQVEKDAQGAISLTLAAASEDPGNPLLQINLSNLALALDQPALASQHLDNARTFDVTRSYDSEISAIQSKILAQQPQKVEQP